MLLTVNNERKPLGKLNLLGGGMKKSPYGVNLPSPPPPISSIAAAHQLQVEDSLESSLALSGERQLTTTTIGVASSGQEKNIFSSE